MHVSGETPAATDHPSFSQSRTTCVPEFSWAYIEDKAKLVLKQDVYKIVPDSKDLGVVTMFQRETTSLRGHVRAKHAAKHDALLPRSPT